MGIVENVGIEQFPQQGQFRGRRCEVCFRYDTTRVIGGVIVRDDNEAPWVTIILLDDGRHVLSGECMYSPEPESKAGA